MRLMRSVVIKMAQKRAKDESDINIVVSEDFKRMYYAYIFIYQ
jgi:hypothetical protein